MMRHHAPPEAYVPEPGSDESYAVFTKERRVIVDDGTTIAYSLRNPSGARVPILFANGWSSSDAYWVDLLPALEAAGHPCIIPDVRGNGLSGLPRQPGRGARNLTAADLSMKRVAADLVHVLDHCRVRPVVVVAHSMGVQASLELYRLRPAYVSALVLVSGTFENPLRTFYGTPLIGMMFPIGRAVMRYAPEVVRSVWPVIGNKQVGHLIARLSYAAGPKATADRLHPLLVHVAASDPAVLIATLDAMRRHSATDLLPRITVPTLVMGAGRDTFTPARCSTEMHERIPGSELVMFPRAGHTLPIEEPAAIARAIEDFLHRRGVDPGAASPGAKEAATEAAHRRDDGVPS